MGGGFAPVPALLVLGYPMCPLGRHVGAVIAVNNATALLARFGAGAVHLDWAVVAAFTVETVAGSLVGVRLVSPDQPRPAPARVRGPAVLVVHTGLRGVLMPV